MSSTPEIASDMPLAVEVEAGREYWWCACGRSATQPFCDGRHAGTDFAPVRWVPTHSGTAWLCGCKRTARIPLCDGAHAQL